MPQHISALKKADLVRIALGLNLGPSKAALDVLHRGELLRKIMDVLAPTTTEEHE